VGKVVSEGNLDQTDEDSTSGGGVVVNDGQDDFSSLNEGVSLVGEEVSDGSSEESLLVSVVSLDSSTEVGSEGVVDRLAFTLELLELSNEGVDVVESSTESEVFNGTHNILKTFESGDEVTTASEEVRVGDNAELRVSTEPESGSVELDVGVLGSELSDLEDVLGLEEAAGGRDGSNEEKGNDELSHDLNN